MESVKYYSNQYAVAYLFGMILKNEIDEQFYHTYENAAAVIQGKLMDIHKSEGGGKSK